MEICNVDTIFCRKQMPAQSSIMVQYQYDFLISHDAILARCDYYSAKRRKYNMRITSY